VSRRSFRDRFLTPPVARAITSPSGILLAGAGASAAILVGLPIAAIVGVGAAAWAARVAVAIPKDASDAQHIDPFALQDPWRSFVRSAQQCRRKFDEAVRGAQHGPLRDRLTEIAGRLDDAVEECWRVARQGQALADARSQLDTRDAQRELASLDQTSPTQTKTAEALQAQIASAQRLETTVNDARDRLRLLDARMDEAVARAIELSVEGGDADLRGLGSDVDGLVGDMEALRQGLEEADRASPGTA
jgi:type IV secretory pathway TrbD component